jgi:AraC-like DNA-binding protein
MPNFFYKKGLEPKWEQLALEADFKVEKMASLCGISERQLERIFKRNFGCTPGQGLRSLRCRLAKELIAQGYSNKAVVAELKFASQSQFCHQFKRVFSSSPQTFAPTYRFKLTIAAPHNPIVINR